MNNNVFKKLFEQLKYSKTNMNSLKKTILASLKFTIYFKT